MSVHKIILLLKGQYKDEAVVKHEDPFKVLISTVLSQRTKDSNTRRASERLFKKYRNAKELAEAKVKDVEKLIYGSGFYRVKARRIIEISREIIERFNDKVPDRIGDLLELRGVGRKTANCVLVYGFGIPSLPVDVHVHRISNRIGLVKTKNPEQTEIALIRSIPKKYWLDFNHLLVRHGQNICLPIKPRCNICLIKRYCSYYKNLKKN